MDDICMTRKAASESGFATVEILSAPLVNINVPPGHIVVFFQRIQHVVHAKKATKDSYRQFRTWRLVKNTDIPPPLNGLDEWSRVIEDMGVPRLPSRQLPPMYSAMHASTQLFKSTPSDPIFWSRHKVKDIFLEDRLCKGTVNNGRHYRIAQRWMMSLRDAKMGDVYGPYKPIETALLRPNKEWTLPIDTYIHTLDDILTLDLIRRDIFTMHL